VLSVGLSVSAVLIFFSFEYTASLLALTPAPLSVSSLVMAAVAGVELAQRTPLVSREEYTNEAIGFVVAPLGSFLLTHLAISIIDADAQNQLDDFTVMATASAVLVSLVFGGYVRMQRRQREATDKLVYTQQQQIYEHSRALNDMELKVVISENQALHNAVEMKRQEVMNVALSIVEQREYLESLNEMVSSLAKTEDPAEKERLISELNVSLKQRLSHDREVDSQYFYAQAESLHEDFNAKLSENFPDLTPQEKRLATLLRLGFSSKYIATLMNITPKSVEISRYRLRQKLGLDKGTNLVNFIKSI
jgi:DNA-binding NarL/FixJ family response regulator